MAEKAGAGEAGDEAISDGVGETKDFESAMAEIIIVEQQEGCAAADADEPEIAEVIIIYWLHGLKDFSVYVRGEFALLGRGHESDGLGTRQACW